jgi:hypothetical protein
VNDGDLTVTNGVALSTPGLFDLVLDGADASLGSITASASDIFLGVINSSATVSGAGSFSVGGDFSASLDNGQLTFGTNLDVFAEGAIDIGATGSGSLSGPGSALLSGERVNFSHDGRAAGAATVQFASLTVQSNDDIEVGAGGAVRATDSLSLAAAPRVSPGWLPRRSSVSPRRTSTCPTRASSATRRPPTST